MAMGKVTISPDVVREVARITTLATPGVLRLAEKPGSRESSRGDTGGVEIMIQDDPDQRDASILAHASTLAQNLMRVRVHVHVLAAADLPLSKLGQQIQTNVIGAVAEIAGIEVTCVDVTFVDVRSQA